MTSQTYYFLAASQEFLQSEPLQEVLEERTRHYQEQGKAVDFYYVIQPAFLGSPALKPIAARLPEERAAVVSTDLDFIRWLKIRLTLVEMGEFVAPSNEIADPLASEVANP
ncbi:MAG: DUF2488 family protein [Cyanobacteriota bacterium]|nr:DUF2488 family protein [Cyanobacteriota bacterium]